MHSELVLTMIAAYFQVKNNLAIWQVVEKLIDSSFGLGSWHFDDHLSVLDSKNKLLTEYLINKILVNLLQSMFSYRL